MNITTLARWLRTVAVLRICFRAAFSNLPVVSYRDVMLHARQSLRIRGRPLYIKEKLLYWNFVAKYERKISQLSSIYFPALLNERRIGLRSLTFLSIFVYTEACTTQKLRSLWGARYLGTHNEWTNLLSLQLKATWKRCAKAAREVEIRCSDNITTNYTCRSLRNALHSILIKVAAYTVWKYH